jgi:hypothetical protein
MSGLRAAAQSYLVMRRTLGFKLTTQGRALMGFIDYCEAHHAEHITAEVALAWATDTPGQHRRGVLEPQADGGAELRPAPANP